MSLTIQSGYRIRLSDGETLMSFSNRIRKEMLHVVETSILKDVVENATGIADTRALKDAGVLKDTRSGSSDKPWITALNIQKALHGDVPFYFSITFLEDPQEEPSANKWLYLLVGSARGSWVDHLASYLKPDGLEDYGYWDNADPQEDVPYHEWQARGEIWKRIGIGTFEAEELGLDMTLKTPRSSRGEVLLHSYPVFNAEVAKSFIPDLDARLGAMMKVILWEQGETEVNQSNEFASQISGLLDPALSIQDLGAVVLGPWN